MCEKINMNKQKKNPFLVPLSTIYRTAPCRNYSKTIHSHVKKTVSEIAKVRDMSDVCLPVT